MFSFPVHPIECAASCVAQMFGWKMFVSLISVGDEGRCHSNPFSLLLQRNRLHGAAFVHHLLPKVNTQKKPTKFSLNWIENELLMSIKSIVRTNAEIALRKTTQISIAEMCGRLDNFGVFAQFTGPVSVHGGGWRREEGKSVATSQFNI